MRFPAVMLGLPVLLFPQKGRKRKEEKKKAKSQKSKDK